MKDAEKNNHGFDWNKIVGFCRKNIRYISAGIMVLILVIVLAVTAADRGGSNGQTKQKETAEEQQGQLQGQDFEEDSIPEINTLIQNYYAAYVKGNVKKLKTYATPISDTEKGYIKLMSKYIKEYTNVKCYTKKGLAEGEYAVSVMMDMRFKGADATAPGLDFFYVRKNADGAYYIDNLYSQFNLQNKELELDSKVEAYITEYEDQEDMVQLKEDVQTRYEQVLSEKKKLKRMVEKTIPKAIKAWIAELTTGDGQTAEKGNAAEENKPDDTQTPEDGQAEQPADDTQTPEENGNADNGETQQPVSETVYALDNVNIRKEPNEGAEKLDSAAAGQSFTRTGTTADGWSEIDYNGSKAYIKSEFLSTEAPVQDTGTTDNGGAADNTDSNRDYIPVGTVITMNTGLNVRSAMSEESERVGTAVAGDTVKVILSYAEGWTKVEWNGKTGYIKTDLLMNN